jgi:hypothetical protein
VYLILGDGGLCGLVCLAGDVIDRIAVGMVGGAQRAGAGRGLAAELAESAAERSCVQPGDEEGVAEPGAAGLVPVDEGDAFDEVMYAQSSEVVAICPLVIRIVPT